MTFNLVDDDDNDDNNDEDDLSGENQLGDLQLGRSLLEDERRRF